MSDELDIREIGSRNSRAIKWAKISALSPLALLAAIVVSVFIFNKIGLMGPKHAFALFLILAVFLLAGICSGIIFFVKSKKPERFYVKLACFGIIINSGLIFLIWITIPENGKIPKLLRTESELTSNYTVTLDNLGTNTFLNSNTVSSIDDIEAMKLRFTNFIRADMAMIAFYRDSLTNLSKSSYTVSEANMAAELSVKYRLALSITELDGQLTMNNLFVLDFLETNFGKWEFGPHLGKIDFWDTNLLDQFNKLNNPNDQVFLEKERLRKKLNKLNSDVPSTIYSQ